MRAYAKQGLLWLYVNHSYGSVLQVTIRASTDCCIMGKEYCLLKLRSDSSEEFKSTVHHDD